MESTAKSYISNSYQGILKSYRHRIFYTLSAVREYTAQRITKNYLFRRIIAPLLDKGIIIASCSRGYKIPISVDDITTYLNQTHTIVSPMLHRVEVCRNLILQSTAGNLDILNDAAFVRYKRYFD